MGILSNADPTEDVVLTSNLFMNNGNLDASRFGHAVYVGAVNSLTAMSNEVCGTNIGHDIKSRAAANMISNNTLYDGAQDANQPTCNIGSSSYALDLPNGGVAVVTGNTMIQGNGSPNFYMFAYGEEGLIYPTNSISFSNNMMDNTVPAIAAILDPADIPITGSGNIFSDTINPISTPSDAAVGLTQSAAPPPPPPASHSHPQRGLGHHG